MNRKLKVFINNRKQQKRDASLFLHYIKKGFYSLSICNYSLCWERKTLFSVFNLLKIKRLYFLKGWGKNDSFCIKKGTEKIVFIANSFVVSKFFNDSSLRLIKCNIDCFLPQLLLPHNSYIDISLERNELVAPFVSGHSFDDELHNSFLLDAMLECSLKSTIIRPLDNDLLFYVQHGDAYGRNVIWRDDKHFLTIDNESVDIYPAFYDVFVLIALSAKTPIDFINQCNKKLEYFITFCKNNKVTFDNSFFDKYVSLFCFYRMKSYPESARPNNHRPFLFLQHETASNHFPNSVNLLEKMNSNYSDDELKRIYEELINSYDKT